MSIYNYLDDEAVANHPLIKGILKEHDKEASLKDKYLGLTEHEKKGKDINQLIREGSSVVGKVLASFSVPISPQVIYNTVREVKYSSEENVKAAKISYNVIFKTLTGINKTATIAVQVNDGVFLNPSMIEWEGKIAILSQSVLDEIIDRNTIYNKPSYPNRPYTKEERNSIDNTISGYGYIPSYSKGFGTDNTRRSSGKLAPKDFKRITERMDKAEKDGEDTFPRSWEHVVEHYLTDVGMVSKDHWYTHLVNGGYVFNYYGSNRGRSKRSQQEHIEQDTEKSRSSDPESSKSEGKAPKSDKALPAPQGATEPPGTTKEAPNMYYENTKTPIDVGDRVKIDVQEGTVHASVEGYRNGMVILMSEKGYYYEVSPADVKPLPSTFKKMYLARKKYAGCEDYINKGDKIAFNTSEGVVEATVEDNPYKEDFVVVKNSSAVYKVHHEDIKKV